jgi:putative zinc finger protein
MSGSDAMTHDYIADQDLVGRYMAGTLPYDERTRFEAHFVDCPRCLDALEDVEPFRDALSAAANEGDLQPKPSHARAWVRRAVGLAAAAVVAVGIADAVRMRRELARANAAAEASERERLGAEQRLHDLTTASAARATQADGATPATALVFPLVKTRGSGGESPQNRVTISAGTGWIVLLADLSAPSVLSASAGVRATIDTADGRRVWSNDRVSPSSTDTLGVAIPSHLLPPGDYVLTLDERRTASDSWRSAGRFMFRVASAVR